MITTLLASVLLFAGGCSDNFDDSALWKGVDEIYNQLTELGKQADELNSQVRLLASVVNGGVVTSITQDAEGNNVVRYKGADNVEHSVTVATKDDVTTAPILGTKEEGGVLYWTTTAGGKTDFLKDTDGAKIPVAGRTPEVAVDKEGYWTVNGRRLTDAAGSPLKAEGKERSLITGISRDAAGNAVFTLGDGSTVSAPVFDAFNIVFKVGDTVLGDEYVVEDASQPLTIGYEITGEKAGETILKIMRTEKLTAAADTAAGTIAVTFGDAFEEGSFAVMLCDTEENVLIRVVRLAAKSAKPEYYGIKTAEDLRKFAEAVNSGRSYDRYRDESGDVVLLGDIDMTGTTEWTPIGTAENPFTGKFDGKGYTIKNIGWTADAAKSTAHGLFGVLNQATVRNLTVGAKGDKLTVRGTAGAGTAVAGVAAFATESVIENVTNNVSISFEAEDPAGVLVMLAGIAGQMTGTTIGGTSAAATCVNNGDITTKVGRASGIVAAANRYTHLTDCANYGNNFNEFATAGGARIGNITCITGTGAKFTKVVNRGDVICKNEGCCGSIVCLVNHDDNEFVGCENYGRVISDRDNNKYKGSFFGQCNKAAVFRNCIAQGDVGTYNDGNYVMVGINADNYMDYLGTHSAAAVNVTRENILYYPAGSTTPAEATFNVAPGSVGLNALGTDAAVVSLSAADYDWTVSTGGSEWVKVTDLNDTPLAAGTKSPYVQQIRITADVNPQTEPRSATVTFASTDLTQTATVSVTQEAAGPAFPSQWIFSASTVGQYNTPWSVSNMLPATSGSSGYISVVRGEANAGREFTRTVNSYKPAVSTMVEGDYWLYTLPVKRLEAGTAVEFDATMAGEANSPKYFIVEYLDGGVWKSVEEDLLTAPEDPSIRYTYKCSGTATGSGYQHASVMQTVRFADPVEGAVQIRCRAVGRYTCSGGTQNISASSSASLLPPFGFSGSYVQNLGTAIPGDTKKVLCLGNSFSYYSNPAWMLKEIAWNEGHYLNVKGHFKGSQNFGQHLELSFSTDAIDIGGYDYAFIQDQSQNPATYGRDGTASIAANCTALADKIRAKSASCKVILEQTWTFSASSYGGFTDFATFENYNAKGAHAMAEAAGTWVSPIGVAFRIVREGSSGINLYHTDNKHQSVYGAYLKACVNYLVLYGEAFGNSPADCGIEASKAAYLRSVAEQVVLGHENEYLIQR